MCKEFREDKKDVEKVIRISDDLNKSIFRLRSKQCEVPTIERSEEIHKLEKNRNDSTCQIRGPAIMAKWKFVKSREDKWTATYLSSCGYTYIYELFNDAEAIKWTLKKTIVGDKSKKENELCKVDLTEEIFEQNELFSWQNMPIYLDCKYLNFVNY